MALAISSSARTASTTARCGVCERRSSACPTRVVRARYASSGLWTAGPAARPLLQRHQGAAPVPARNTTVVAKAASGDGEPEFKKNTEFGYSRKDVILIGLGFFALGYALYYGLQATGMDAGMAGAWVQLIVTLTMMVGWLASYLFRVANKDMTYVKQLEDYETAVMAKRMEEMPEAELEKMLDELESEKKKQQ